MHHRRHRPRNQRAGCKRCKPWKVNGAKRQKFNLKPADRRQTQLERDTEEVMDPTGVRGYWH